ncbi:hypothetical protein BC831DRAFT_9069 [Entophlyctis helioformis]|nr:hypothetical protein BC831DRAFT_9069 [Entophlyctis helioformis]
MTVSPNNSPPDGPTPPASPRPSTAPSVAAITTPPRPIAAPSVTASSSKSKLSKWYDRLACGSEPDIGPPTAPTKSAFPSVSAVEDDEQRSAAPRGVPISSAVVAAGDSNKLVAMLEEEVARIRTADPSKPDDLVDAINGIAGRLFELQSQVVEETRSAAAVVEDDSQAQAAKSATADAAFDKLKGSSDRHSRAMMCSRPPATRSSRKLARTRSTLTRPPSPTSPRCRRPSSSLST